VNIKEYINSGIIESYVLGLTTKAEQQEFESLCAQYPEIVQAKDVFELLLEEQLMKEALEPPANVKQQIFQSLNSAGIKDASKKEKADTAPVRRMNVWKSIAAAFILLSAATCYYAYSIRNNYQKLQRVNNELQNQLRTAYNDNPLLALNPIVKKTSTKWAAMIQPTNASHCMAHIYWDTISKNTYLLVGNIPVPASHKQFQLWALQDKQPVNLGVFDATKEGQVLQMKNIYRATAFVITLEPVGGSTAPTMETVYAIAKL
jgi:anti-sigma-K factor RskA